MKNTRHIFLCEHCLEAIRSRGEKLYDDRCDDDERTECEWCGEETDELLDCVFE